MRLIARGTDGCLTGRNRGSRNYGKRGGRGVAERRIPLDGRRSPTEPSPSEGGYQPGREEALYSEGVSPFMALFLLACGPTFPAPKTVPVATRLVETIEAEGPTGNTVILLGKVIDSVQPC